MSLTVDKAAGPLGGWVIKSSVADVVCVGLDQAAAFERMAETLEGILERQNAAYLRALESYRDALKAAKEEVETARAARAAEDAELKSGDVVRLRSGGPAMTVGMVQESGIAMATCRHFTPDGTELVTCHLPAVCLVRVEPEQCC